MTAHRVQQIIRRVLDEPDLARAVQALEPRVLARVIDHIGLEDSGELIALATTAQLQGIFDEDLWRSARPGHDEDFDARRFGVWLEILLEVGERFAARKLVELPEELVRLALHRLVLVVDLDALAVEMSERGGDDDVEMLEKALEDTLHVEIDRWRVIARRPEGWDALAAVLLAVDAEDHDFLERLLERLAHASSRDIEDGGGLYSVLTESETVAADASADREDRRARSGFIAPSQAAAFLALARRDGAGGAERDPITRAYFRELEPPSRTEAAAGAARAPLVEMLRDAGVVDRPPPPLLTGRRDEESPFRRALRSLPPADAARMPAELAYLANVLVAGLELGERPLRPLEAAEIVLAVCERGLDVVGAMAPADRLFRAGWKAIDDPRAFARAIVVRANQPTTGMLAP